MFTGIIVGTGRVVSLTQSAGAARLVIAAEALRGRWQEGDSIAVNGVCLTAIPLPDPAQFAADLAQETIDRTTLISLAQGANVNLELPTPAGAPLGGHVVQGHVDGTATVVSVTALHPDSVATSDWRLVIDLPPALAANVIQQGSITVDGISLTVAKLDLLNDAGARIEIAIIPHTYAVTNLHALRPGSTVNIETDVLAKYARRRDDRDWLNVAGLLAGGY